MKVDGVITENSLNSGLNFEGSLNLGLNFEDSLNFGLNFEGIVDTFDVPNDLDIVSIFDNSSTDGLSSNTSLPTTSGVSTASKGQLNSKVLFDVIVWTKEPTKFF